MVEHVKVLSLSLFFVHCAKNKSWLWAPLLKRHDCIMAEFWLFFYLLFFIFLFIHLFFCVLSILAMELNVSEVVTSMDLNDKTIASLQTIKSPVRYN